MTVPVQDTFTASTANGVTTVFPYGFKIAAAEDLVVTIDDVIQTSGYTVSGVGNQYGGNVTFDTAPANGAEVIRYLDPVLKRDTDYQQFGDWRAQNVNLDFDRIWLALRSMKQLATRAIKMRVNTTDDQVITEAPADRALKVIGFDALGKLKLYIAQAGTSLIDLAASTGASLIGFLQNGTGASARTVQSKLRDVVSVKDFGAVGDGSTDDTAAINAALAALSAGDALHFPAGTYKFTSALSTSLSRISIRGDGSFQTVLKYAGANTTNDIITIGDGVTGPVNWVIEGVRIASDTTMTGGFALRAKKLCRSHMFDVVFDGQDGNQKLYSGVWFDQCDDVQMTQHKVYVQAEGVRVNGGIGSVPKAGLFIHGGKITGGTIGIRVAGAFGGLYVDQTDIIAQTQAGVLLDNSQVAETNRETFLGPTCVIDSVSNGGGAGHGIHINESFTSGQTLQLTGTWVASSGSHGIYVQSAPGYKITIVGARIFNHGGDGVRCADNTALVSVVGCSITNNGGYGVNGVNASNNVLIGPNSFASNTSGGFNNTVSPASELNSQKQRIGHVVVEDQLEVDASYRNIGDYTSTYHLDTSDAYETIANGGTLDIANFSGMVIINNHYTGGVHVYIAGAGTTALVSSTGGAVGTLAYQASVNGYRFTNNTGSSYNYGFAIFRTRFAA